MIARSFAHSSPGCEPIGVILTFCASAGNAASKRANAAQAIFMSFLLKRLASRRSAVGFGKAVALIGNGERAVRLGRHFDPIGLAVVNGRWRRIGPRRRDW